MAHLSPFSVPWHARIDQKGITADFGSQGPSATPTLECLSFACPYLPFFDENMLFFWPLGTAKNLKTCCEWGAGMRNIFIHSEHSWEGDPHSK